MIADGYGKMKEEAQRREKWRRRTLEPAQKAENQKKMGLNKNLFWMLISRRTQKNAQSL